MNEGTRSLIPIKRTPKIGAVIPGSPLDQNIVVRGQGARCRAGDEEICDRGMPAIGRAYKLLQVV